MKYAAVLTGVILVFSFRGMVVSETAETMNRRGIEYGKQKRYEQAIKEFDKSLDIYNTKSARTLHNKGWVLEKKGDIDKAIEYYREAAERNPRQVPSHVRLGYLYYKTGKYEDAVNTGEYVLKIDPENNEVKKWLPEAYKMKISNPKKKKKEEKSEVPDREKPEEEKKDEERDRYFYHDIFFKLGYIPTSRISFDDYAGTIIGNRDLYGFAFRIDYSALVFKWLWIELAGVEYEKCWMSTSTGKYGYDFIDGGMAFKYLSQSGFFAGLGTSAKYLLRASNPSGDINPAEKKVDWWVSGIVGFCYQAGENFLVLIENRFGWNITRNQFEKFKDISDKFSVNYNYDFTFYFGTGFRFRTEDPEYQKK